MASYKGRSFSLDNECFTIVDALPSGKVSEIMRSLIKNMAVISNFDWTSNINPATLSFEKDRLLIKNSETFEIPFKEIVKKINLTSFEVFFNEVVTSLNKKSIFMDRLSLAEAIIKVYSCHIAQEKVK